MMFKDTNPRLLARCTSNAFALLSEESGKPVTLFVARGDTDTPELIILPAEEMRQLALHDATRQLMARRGNGTAEPFVPFAPLLHKAMRAHWHSNAQRVPHLYETMNRDPNLHIHVVFKAANMGLMTPAAEKKQAIAAWQAECAFNSIKEHAGGFRTCGRGISTRILLGKPNITPLSFDVNP